MTNLGSLSDIPTAIEFQDGDWTFRLEWACRQEEWWDGKHRLFYWEAYCSTKDGKSFTRNFPGTMTRFEVKDELSSKVAGLPLGFECVGLSEIKQLRADLKRVCEILFPLVEEMAHQEHVSGSPTGSNTYETVEELKTMIGRLND